MFIEIKWKNSKGDEMKTLVESTKVQGFINEFTKRDVQTELVMPEDVTILQPLEGLPLQN
jgi:hypothetical protein|tara:strand:+ start:79 stop:258 length:180 start_codon:yes stop_codon:yes gene_type:complete